MARLPNQNMTPGRPAKPPGLTPRAAKEWDRIMTEIEAAQIQITPAHRSILELAANISADMLECLERIARDGEYITTKAGLVAHPFSASRW
jgi:hypothetical protein